MKRETSREEYVSAFEMERTQEYPVIDALERSAGFAIDRQDLENMARTLACPVKVNPPCWQHGRVIYSVLRKMAPPKVRALDIGTAKGFSALCIRLALDHGGFVDSLVASVDVIEPDAKVRRNTLAEVGGYKTLYEILEPFEESRRIKFCGGGSANLLQRFGSRINFAFVDGKHTYNSVAADCVVINSRQDQGDVIMFDDVQIPNILMAVRELEQGKLGPAYEVEIISAKPERQYAVARKL